MKNERIMNVLGEVEGNLIEEAAPIGKRKKPRAYAKWLTSAACLVLATGIGVGLWQSGWLQDRSHEAIGGDKVYPEKLVERPATDSEIGLIPKWEEMNIDSRFPEVTYQGARYSMQNAEIAPENVGERLGTATLNGYDVYTEMEYSANAELYAINGILTECAVALQFEGRDDYFVYLNSAYCPQTLGDLIAAFDLTENVSFGSVWYRWKIGNERILVEFVDLPDEKVWEMLLSDTSLENVYDQRESYISLMSVSVDIPLLGYENISLAVTEDGFLTTNIGNTGKAFYIGKEKAEQFVTYVKETCQGYEIIYVDGEGSQIAE